MKMRIIGWGLLIWGLGVVFYSYGFSVVLDGVGDPAAGIAMANNDLMAQRAMIHDAGWAQQIMGVILIGISYLRPTPNKAAPSSE